MCEGNDQADRHASLAIQQLPPEVLQVREALAADNIAKQEAHEYLLDHIVRVGRIFTQLPHKGDFEQESATTENVEPVNLVAIVGQVQDRIPASFQFAGLQQWLQWFQSLTVPDAALRWVSWHELLVHYQFATGQRGLECQTVTSGNHRQWKLQSTLNEYSFAESSRSFGHFGMQILKTYDPNWKSLQRRPTYWKVQFWCGCLPLKMPITKLQKVHQWFEEQHPNKAFTNMKGKMAALPPVSDIPVEPQRGRIGLWKFFK